MLWHNDGHKITLRINKAELEILDIYCPNGRAGECHHDRWGCMVQFFIDRFGLECNVGVCPASEILQICWSIVGDRNDIEACQLWFVPLNDEVFHAWLVSKNKP